MNRAQLLARGHRVVRWNPVRLCWQLQRRLHDYEWRYLDHRVPRRRGSVVSYRATWAEAQEPDAEPWPGIDAGRVAP